MTPSFDAAASQRRTVSHPSPSDVIAHRRNTFNRDLPAADDGRRSPEFAAGLPRSNEISAGGIVITTSDCPAAALIARLDRRGRLLWSLPKGHLEAGESREEAAVREVEEETGIRGDILASLGSIRYWFVAEGKRVHKTVHHFLMRAIDGQLSDEDAEVVAVAWVPLGELRARLAYADERRIADEALRILADSA